MKPIAPTPVVEYDPGKHLYRVAGEVKPSVTQVFKVAGLYPDYGHGENMTFGTTGHRVIELILKGQLSGYDPMFEPWMIGIRKFIEIEKPDVFEDYSEKVLYSPRYGFAGTPDFFGTLAGRSVLWNLDWKFWAAASKQLLQLAGMQTAGYTTLFHEQGELPVCRRAAVHFYEEDYRIYTLTDPADWPNFQSALNVTRLKISMGLYSLGERKIEDENRTDRRPDQPVDSPGVSGKGQ